MDCWENGKCQACLCNVTVKDIKLHVLGRKHKRNYGMYEKQQRAFRSVFVTNYDPTKTTEMNLMEYLRKFGPIENIRLVGPKNCKSYSIVTFQRKEFQVAALQKRCHIFLGRRISVAPERSQDTFKSFQLSLDKKMKEYSCMLHEQFVEFALKAENITEQMQFLVSVMEDQIAYKLGIVQELKILLSEYFPRCSVHAFGSTVNMVGFKGSDLDVFVDLGLNIAPETPELLETANEAMKGVSYLEVAKRSPSELEKLGHSNLMKLVFAVLKRWLYTSCENRVLIHSCRIPLIKFVHRATKIKCDLNIKNRLGIKNSLLIHTYTFMDPRVRPLLMTFRYWFKIKGFIGNITSYAVTMLVLYFLQTLPIPVIPKVCTLMEHAPEEIIDGYSCNFSLGKFPKSKNVSTCEELLLQLFKFCTTFNFAENVICMKTATSTKKDSFEVDGKLLEAFQKKPMAIQDPFELINNITSNVDDKKLEYIKRNIALTYETLTSKRPATGKWGLALILNENVLPQDKLFEKFTICKTASSRLLSIDKWRRNICEFIIVILTKVLFFECIVLEKNYSIDAGDQSDEIVSEKESETTDRSSSGKTLLEDKLATKSDPVPVKDDPSVIVNSARDEETVSSDEVMTSVAEHTLNVHSNESTNNEVAEENGDKKFSHDLHDSLINHIKDVDLANLQSKCNYRVIETDFQKKLRGKTEDLTEADMPVNPAIVESTAQELAKNCDFNRSTTVSAMSSEYAKDQTIINSPPLKIQCLDRNALQTDATVSNEVKMSTEIPSPGNEIHKVKDDAKAVEDIPCKSKESNESSLLLLLHCKAFWNTWQGRKKPSSAKKCKNALDIAETTSLKLKSNVPRSENPILEFKFVVENKSQKLIVKTMIMGDTNIKSFSMFNEFLRSFLPSIINQSI